MIPQAGADHPSRQNVLWMLFDAAFTRMGEAADRWRQDPGDETLHDFRVALRRFRVHFRIFREQVSSCHDGNLPDDLAVLGDHLGAARDWDVMIALVEKLDSADPAMPQRLIQAMRVCQRTPRRAAERFMRGAAWKRLVKECRRFLDALALAAPASGSIKKFHDRAFRQQCRRILLAKSLVRSEEAEVLHTFRIKLRRLRYLGDLLAEYSNQRQRKAITEVRATEQALGRLHDLDLAIDFVTAHPELDAGAAVEAWRATRARRLKKFRRLWRGVRPLLDEFPDH